MPDTQFHSEIKAFDALTPEALYRILKLRVDVFVVEQNCAYHELDDKDQTALHLTFLDNENLVAYARLLPPETEIARARIGRVVTAPNYRGQGVGNTLLSDAIAACEHTYPGHKIALSAQSHLTKFYARFGFVAVSTEYMEDGIPHIDMERA